MATYSASSVNVTAGSAIVIGNNTDFRSNAAVGNIFKLSSENVTYEIGAVNTATRLTLTSRYTNSSEELYWEEHVATTNSATYYSDTLANTPVIQNTVIITASWQFTDDGAGTLTATPNGTGTIDYDSGLFSITLTSNLSASYALTATYYSGNTLNSTPYQIVRDYTTNYSFPESVPSDKNLAYIFTKAMRMIDLELKTLEDRIASWH